MRLFKLAALLALSMVVSGAAPERAADVRYSHGCYHRAVCRRPAAPGTVRCHARIVTAPDGRVLMNALTAGATPSGYGPDDLRAAYGITGSGSAATLIAVVDAYGYQNAEADLNVYRARFGLPPCTSANGCFRRVNQAGADGSYPPDNTGWAQETALDLDMVSAMCPNCRIVLVEANSTDLADFAVAENTAAALGAHVISNSYGGDETGADAYESAYNHPGVAITVSTGDSGYAAGPQFPATSPHVTAVGGTSLSRDGSPRGWTETVWSQGGSGCSKIFAKPHWQIDPLCKMRMVADVSAVADPATGVAVYGPGDSGGAAWEVFGGTSVAAPLIAGIYGVNGGPVHYGRDPYRRPDGLNGVSKGSNGVCDGTYFCVAVTGYSGPSGLGTPKNATPF
jgi:subtilase family serine protease